MGLILYRTNIYYELWSLFDFRLGQTPIKSNKNNLLIIIVMNTAQQILLQCPDIFSSI
jgi:hypothetical protein